MRNPIRWGAAIIAASMSFSVQARPDDTSLARARDLEVAAPSVQAFLSPVPIYVEAPSLGAHRVIVLFKPFGTARWQKLELARLGSGHGGEIPCSATSTTGTLAYYVEAVDSEGDVVATIGTRGAPIEVTITRAFAGDPPHLPGRPPPRACSDAADCPPGLAGCGGRGDPSLAAAAHGWGQSCANDRECAEGLACRAGRCEVGNKASNALTVEGACLSNADCSAAEACVDRACRPKPPRPPGLWLTLGVQGDFLFAPSQDDVCGTASNEAAPTITCNAGAAPYSGIPDTTASSGGNNRAAGGARAATARILLGAEYLITRNVSLGGRAGITLGNPRGRLLGALHAEARAAYWIGTDPFGSERLRPFAAIVVGVGEIQDQSVTPVTETICRTEADCALPGNQARGLSPSPTVTVWRRYGAPFAGAALGVMIPTSRGQGVVVEAKGLLFVPGVFSLSPYAGYAVAF